MKNIITKTLTVAVLAGAIAFTGCQTGGNGRKAVVELNPASGSNVRGTVTFRETKHGIRVEAAVTGLTPGLHGFHIHEKGDCSAPDATSAGGHFNPAGQPHGGPTDFLRHSGDLGNLTANDKGEAKFSALEPKLTFDGPSSIIGRAVIVHEKPDDLKSQPAGNAGPRIACGVINLK